MPCSNGITALNASHAEFTELSGDISIAFSVPRMSTHHCRVP